MFHVKVMPAVVYAVVYAVYAVVVREKKEGRRV